MGVAGALAFAVLFVLWFLNFDVNAALWADLAFTVICFIAAKYFIVPEAESKPFVGDSGDADDGNTDVDNGSDDVPDSEGNEIGKDEDNSGGK